MKNKILITDSLFMFDKQIKRLEAAGFNVERLDKVKATEAELKVAVKDAVGYILGGTEAITEPVLQAAPYLKAIAFTGIDFSSYIPAWQQAKARGILLSTTPDGPTHAVAEWAISAALAMNRHFFELGRTGDQTFMTTPGLENQKIGIVGLGRVGKHIADMLTVFRPASISYYSRHKHPDTDLAYKPLAKLLNDSDVVFACVSGRAKHGYIGAKQLAQMKDGALLVTIMHPGVLDEAALLPELQSGRLRAISDYPASDPAFTRLPLASWFCFNGSNAFNATSETRLVSDTVTDSMINMLTTGEDKYRVTV